MKLAIVAVAVLLAGCAVAGKPIRQAPYMRTFVISVAETDKIPFKCAKHSSVVGCAVRDTSRRACVVIVPRFSDQRDYRTLETWGHELAHCVKGKWHE